MAASDKLCKTKKGKNQKYFKIVLKTNKNLAFISIKIKALKKVILEKKWAVNKNRSRDKIATDIQLPQSQPPSCSGAGAQNQSKCCLVAVDSYLECAAHWKGQQMAEVRSWQLRRAHKFMAAANWKRQLLLHLLVFYFFGPNMANWHMQLGLPQPSINLANWPAQMLASCQTYN